MRAISTSEPDSDRIFVKKDNLARCAWCGTPESPKWVSTQKNEIFCSSECRAAMYAFRAINGGFLTACFGGIIMLIPILVLLLRPPQPSVQLGSVVEWAVWGILLFISGIGIMVSGIEGKKYQERKDMYRDVTLLVCEYCTQTNPPSVTRCKYCGASLTKAPFKYETTPPWIRKEMHLGRFRCPHCSATYSYDASKLENDGTVKCQNCIKPFTPPFSVTLQQEASVELFLYSDV